MKNKLLSLFLLILFTSCSSIQKQELNFDKPEIQIPKVVVKPNNKIGSLYSRKGASLFADKKDLQVGDIIQVTILEQLNGTTSNSRDLSSKRKNNLQGGLVTSLNAGPLTSGLKKFNNNLGFGIKSDSSSSFEALAESTLNEYFKTIVSVIIQETYQNGNYYIKGSKEMLLDGQRQEIKISGVIRPYDIKTDNSIDSTQIANLKILYIKAGEEDNVTHMPWGTKILNFIWPF
ncbi:MAG: flagellar basal body L-ring protein FlgH [Campylobacteraceae bacterium]|nr:flagellar basal body L-ring protein FlgH [Campylobacteraceae bacterium]